MPFINGIGLISPQKTAESDGFLAEVMEYEADFLQCLEPVYRNYIDPILSRRMSRLVKMGIASAKMGLKEAEISMPDAIITGTGLGSVEDTEKILAEISVEERFLNPTPFIQSTYNTISSQVAIILKCLNYNSTYVHRTFSFESGLIDALLQMHEGTANNVLVGAIDEMTLNHLQITRRIGLWKMKPVNNLKLLATGTPGALAGEGAGFFVIGTAPSPSTYAKLTDVSTWINIHGSFHTGKALGEFLRRNELKTGDIDILLLGNNGDSEFDPIYDAFASHFPSGTCTGYFKHLCGEYHTATGFGLYVAANIIRRQQFPGILHLGGSIPGKINNILIYNHFKNRNHAMMLIQV